MTVMTIERKLLKELPDPPANCSEKEAKLFREKSRKLFDKGELYEDMIDGLAELCGLEIWENNIKRRRKRVIEALKLESYQVSDISLKNKNNFDRRVDSYLSEAEDREEAYEMAEADYVKVFGDRNYKHWDSYRNARRAREKRAKQGCE